MKNFFKFIQDAVENVKEEAGKALENAQDLSQDLTATFQKQMEEAQKQMEEVQRQIMEAQANAQNPSAENENNGGLGNMLQGFLGSLEGFGGENSTQQQESQNETKVFKQIFKDLNEGEIVKFKTPDGNFIVSKNHFHCQGDYSSGSIETHYDIVNNALQILDITYNEGKVTEVSHKLCEFSNIEITDSGWNYPRLHTDMLGVVVVYTHESVPSYTYKIDSKEVERVCYSSSYDIGLSTDKDPRNSFKIVEELILPNISAEMQAFYHSSVAQTKREEQIASKVREINYQKSQDEENQRIEQSLIDEKNEKVAKMKALAARPIKHLQTGVDKYGLPKENFFITKTGEKIDFKGELIACRSDYAETSLNAFATYLYFTEDADSPVKMVVTAVKYEQGKVEFVGVYSIRAHELRGTPDGSYYNVKIKEFSSFVNLTFTSNGYVEEERYFEDENTYTKGDEISINSVDLEDTYSIAARIFQYMNEYSQKDFEAYLSALQDGTFQESTTDYEDESDDYQADTYQNNNSSSSSSSSKKEDKKQEKPTNSSSTKKELFDIKIKNDQKDGSVTVYNQNRGGSYNIQRGITTTIKCYAGDKLFDYEGHKKGRLLFVVDESMDGKVQLFTKL